MASAEVGGTKVATLGIANLVTENSVGQTAGVSDQSDDLALPTVDRL